MLKHIGKQGDRKVAIIFREVPGEDHMALVVYPDLMKVDMHDSLMAAIESAEGQAANNLGEAIHARLFPDGRQMLAALHAEGMLKKVQTETVIVTPAQNANVRLDEMNKIIREMESGAEAAAKLAELDADAGYTGKASRKDDYGRDIGAPPASVQQGSSTIAGSDAALQANQSGALGDSVIANNMKAQAERMAAEAKGLIAESERMLAEAAEMLGESPTPAPKKRGRPAKAKAKA
jgi:hypothetical protein